MARKINSSSVFSGRCYATRLKDSETMNALVEIDEPPVYPAYLDKSMMADDACARLMKSRRQEIESLRQPDRKKRVAEHARRIQREYFQR